MDRGRRPAALGAGLLALVLGAVWTSRSLDQQQLYRYGLEWFLKLSPGEAAFYTRTFLLGAVGVLGVAWGVAPWLRGWAGKPALSFRPWLLGLAGAAVVATLGIGVFVLKDQVVTDDEYVYLFQARTLLTGRAALPAPPGPEFLTNAFVLVRDGRWFGQYPPGHPLALMPGIALGIPRLVPWVLSGLNLWLTGLILRRLAGTSWALAGAGLLLLSPLFLLTGSTLLSHSSAYFGLSLGVLGAIRVLEGRGAVWGLAAGLGIGFLFLTRPWTGVTLGLFPAALLVRALVRGRERKAFSFALAGMAVCGAFFLVYNQGISADPLTTGYQAVRGEGQREFGFGTILPGIHDHTPVQGIRNAALLGVRFLFWAWGCPLLLLVAIPAFLDREGGKAKDSRVRRTAARGALLMLGMGLLSYVPYWSVGVNDTGPVKTFELLLPASVLATLGLKAGWERFGTPAPAWVLASILAAAVTFWPPQLRHLREISDHVREPLDRVERSVEIPALVFVAGVQTPEPGSWVFGRPNPRPDLSDAILYVRDRGPENPSYWRFHPGRHAYRLLYRDGAFQVIPLKPEKP